MNIETNNTRDDDWFDSVGKYERQEALEQPSQEPVAWRNPNDDDRRHAFMWHGKPRNEKQFSIPLYTHPAPAREALSEKAIVEAMSKADITAYGDAVAFNKRIMKLARAIEQAHGIGS
jgi:hypothetical protein